MSLTVGVFYHESGKPWTMLPTTSAYITELGHVPSVGDRIALRSADHSLVLAPEAGEGSQGQRVGPPADFYKTVVTVTDRVYNHSLCEIALVCEHKPFE